MRVNTVKHARQPYKCEKCGAPILTGEGYKYIVPRVAFNQPGVKRVRCPDCPTWQEWEYSQRRTQPIMELQATYADDLVDVTPDTAQDVLDQWGDTIQEVADGAQESFDAMGEGLQQTENGQRLEEMATELSSWADEVGNIDVPDSDNSDYEHEQCATCDGDGQCECATCEGCGVDQDAEGDTDDEKGPCPDCDGNGTVDCPDCDGTGHSDNLTDDGLAAWRDAFQNEVTAVLDNCPVEL